MWTARCRTSGGSWYRSWRAVDRLIREEVAARTLDLEREKYALRALTVSIAETLINAMEAKDVYLRGHSHRVAELSAAIAEELMMPYEFVEQARLAGRLHDVGKIGIREAVLNKAGPPTEDEFAHVKDHVRIGVEILSPCGTSATPSCSTRIITSTGTAVATPRAR